VGSLGDRCIYGHWTGCGMRPGEARVTADNRVKRIEHGDVDNRHGAAGTPWPELFTENAVLTRSDRSVVETGGINRIQIPPEKRIESVSRTHKRRDIVTGVKERAKGRIEPFIQNCGEAQSSHDETRKQYKSFFHASSFPSSFYI